MSCGARRLPADEATQRTRYTTRRIISSAIGHLEATSKALDPTPLAEPKSSALPAVAAPEAEYESTQPSCVAPVVASNPRASMCAQNLVRSASGSSLLCGRAGRR